MSVVHFGAAGGGGVFFGREVGTGEARPIERKIGPMGLIGRIGPIKRAWRCRVFERNVSP